MKFKKCPYIVPCRNAPLRRRRRKGATIYECPRCLCSWNVDGIPLTEER